MKENYSGLKGIFKFIARIVSLTTLVILILLGLFLAYYTISVRIYASKGEKFEPFISLYTIVSGSMEPNIKVYDVVVSMKVKSPESIKVGDVITFTSTASLSKGKTITHRVIEVLENDGETVYRTKGDNNLSPDSAPATYHNVIGKVVLRIPALGRVQNFIGTQGGWLIVIVIPALFIIISDILKIFKLTGVKNKIVHIDEENKRIKRERQAREESRKEDIKKRLKLDKSIYEPDPIVTKKQTVTISGAHKSVVKEFNSNEILSRSNTRDYVKNDMHKKKNKKKKRNKK